jgi:hypothetical protein
MNVKEMGPNDQPLDTVEINYHSLSTRKLMRHLTKLPGLRITKKTSWPMTDDLWIWFEYKGFKFIVETPFVDYWVRRESEDCPEEIFREIINHLRAYRPSPLRAWFVAVSERRRAKAIDRLLK